MKHITDLYEWKVLVHAFEQLEFQLAAGLPEGTTIADTLRLENLAKAISRIDRSKPKRKPSR